MTVAAAGLALVLVALAGLVAVLGAVAVARHRAEAAADLAALAAAAHVLEGAGPACQAAAAVVRAQRAELVACRLDGPTATVDAAVRLGVLGTVRSRARAGPVRPSGGATSVSPAQR